MGPVVTISDDSKWRSDFYKLVRHACAIIIIPIGGKEVPWELNELRDLGLMKKTLVIIPSTAAVPNWLIQSSNSFLESLKSNGFTLPRLEKRTQILSLWESGAAKNSSKINELNYAKTRVELRKRFGLQLW